MNQPHLVSLLYVIRALFFTPPSLVHAFLSAVFFICVSFPTCQLLHRFALVCLLSFLFSLHYFDYYIPFLVHRHFLKGLAVFLLGSLLITTPNLHLPFLNDISNKRTVYRFNAPLYLAAVAPRGANKASGFNARLSTHQYDRHLVALVAVVHVSYFLRLFVQ